MGISGLNNFIFSNVQGAVKTYPYAKYGGKVFVFDTNILLYKYCYMYPNDMPSFVLCFMYKIITLLSNGIMPVFVFDGKPPIEKDRVIKRRYINKKQIREKLNRLNEVKNKTFRVKEQISKLEKQSFTVTRFHKQAVQRLFDHLGVPWFNAEGEAEEMCAILQKNGIVDYTVSEDTDTFVFGCDKVIRMLKNSSSYVKEISLPMILRSTGMSYEKFVDMCILAGCDYTDSINGVNIKTCYSMMSKFGTIEACIEEIRKKYIIPKSFDYERVRDIYIKDSKAKENTVYDLQSIKSDIRLKEFDELEFKNTMIKNFMIPSIEVEQFIFKIRWSRKLFFKKKNL